MLDTFIFHFINSKLAYFNRKFLCYSSCREFKISLTVAKTSKLPGKKSLHLFHAGVLAIIYITSLTRIYLLPHRRFSLGCSCSIELMASIFSWGWLEVFICLLIIWGEKVGLDLQCFATYTELDTSGKMANLKNRTWNSLPLSFIWYRQNDCCFSWVHLSIFVDTLKSLPW